MIAVFDTNVLIPLILEASRSTRLFRRLRASGHKVATSPEILEEVREKMLTSSTLRKWLALPGDEIVQFLEDLATICVVVPGLIGVHGVVVDDPDDDMILSAAVESRAEYIVSEDLHLLKLHEWQGIKIMNRDDFSAELDRLESEV